MRDELSIITVKIAIHDLFCLMYIFCIIQFTDRFFWWLVMVAGPDRQSWKLGSRSFTQFSSLHFSLSPLVLLPVAPIHNVNKLWSINSKLLSTRWKLSNYKSNKEHFYSDDFFNSSSSFFFIFFLSVAEISSEHVEMSRAEERAEEKRSKNQARH